MYSELKLNLSSPRPQPEIPSVKTTSSKRDLSQQPASLQSLPSQRELLQEMFFSDQSDALKTSNINKDRGKNTSL